MRGFRRAHSIATVAEVARLWTVAVVLLPLVAGCSGARLLAWPWLKDEIPMASARNPVHRIICMWEPSEGRGPDGLPARGFAGQVLFFTRTSSTPVKVEGDVRVYVFDDFGPDGNPAKPLHQFDFLHSEAGDAWNRHLTISALGPSYSVFIPYTRRGRQQARCALQVRYTPPGEVPMFSDLSTIVLPGPTEDDAGHPAVQPQPLPQPVQTVSHYIDGPYGRQLVGGSPPPAPLSQTQPPAQTVAPSTTPAIGSVVKTAEGIALRQPPRTHGDSAVQPASAIVPAASLPAAGPGATPALSAIATPPAGTTGADRLDRIEQMLERLARQVQGTSDAAAQSAAGPGRDGITSASSDVDREGPNASQGAPASLDNAALDGTARRVPPRPSWFDQARASADPAVQPRRALSPEPHPLRSAAARAW